MGTTRPSASDVISAIVATALLVVFSVVVIWTLSETLSPPLQADPAPESRPLLLCVQTGKPAEKSGSPASQSGRTTRADREKQVLRVHCPGGEIQPAPQARGAYDPNERFIGVLAIVAPLITTIVAFFFGARAGAGEGRSEAARAQASKAALANRVRDIDDSLYDKLKTEGRI